MIRDGKSLPISNIGFNHFFSSFNLTCNMIFKNILHVLHIEKKLSSVSKFTQDNKVYFELHHSICHVKD